MAKKKTMRIPHKMIAMTTESITPSPVISQQPSGFFKKTKLLYFVLALLALSALLLANKQLLLAGVVNGKPIWSWQLNKTMTDRFGKQTLEGIISERLIADEAAKQRIAVSGEDIDKKQAEILKTLGGNMSVDEFLKYQGITRSDFDNQIRLQLTVQKILGRGITITDADVDSYINTNRATLAATAPAQLQSEARQAILDAKVGEKLQGWFTELKGKAKILRFL